MKRFNKLFIILLCCVGAMSITSCINSDDDGGIDPETYRTYLTQMAGPYNGFSSDWRYQNKIYFYNDTITDKNNPYKTDSVESTRELSVGAFCDIKHDGKLRSAHAELTRPAAVDALCLHG